MGKRLRLNLGESGGMFGVFLALFVLASIFVPNFFSVRNMQALALAVCTVGMVACTMLFCLASGDFDLSVEAVVAFSGVLGAVVMGWTHSVLLGIASGLSVGALVGLVNGLVIAKFGINALITTLATMQIVRGLGFIVSGGRAVGIAEEKFFLLGGSLYDFFPEHGPGPLHAFRDWAAPVLQGIAVPVVLTVLCFLFFGFLLARTAFGRNTLAVGGNREAARLAGVNVDRIKIIIFTMQGLVAGFAGIVLASRMTSGQPNCAMGFALEVISACVLGGVSLTGGRGTMIGTVVGVLILGLMQNAMNLLNIPTFYQYVARGLVLLAAVLFDRFRQARMA